MASTPNRSRELVLPVETLAGLRELLTAELGAEGAAALMRRLGHRAGDALLQLLNAAPDQGRAEFWRRLDAFFGARGWGRIAHEPLHEGIGALESADWAEADGVRGADRPGCHFTTGLFSNILGRLAGGQIGVIETECRGRGDLRCRFLFGARPALDHVHGAIRAGADADRAVASLT